MVDPESFFRHPFCPGQKQYEALRGYYIDHVPGQECARRFGYTYTAFNSLKQRFKAGALQFLLGRKDRAFPQRSKHRLSSIDRNDSPRIKSLKFSKRLVLPSVSVQ
jgi:hypothetical protein